MNEIIAWLANNNTLLIRIGTTAVILLLVVYVFRFFFVPRVSEAVTVDHDTPSTDTVKTPTGDQGGAPSNEELVKLQAEISTLKFKLKEAEVEKAELVKNQSQAASESEKSTEKSEPVEDRSRPQSDNSAQAPDPEEVKALNEKIKSLESRLSEYEIIAEDIAEISLLRAENEHLKNKVFDLEKNKNISASQNDEVSLDADSVLSSVDDSVETSTTDESVDLSAVSESPIAADDLGADERLLLEAELEAEAEKILATQEAQPIYEKENIEEVIPESIEQEAHADHVVVKSEVEVTSDEQDILNEFENFKKAKKG